MKDAHQETKPTEKKPYARPELIKHGTVEAQTQVIVDGTSQPTR